MKDDVASPTHAGYRFPAEIIVHAVWRSFRFALSYRDVEELLAGRGGIVTDAAIRRGAREIGQADANTPRRRRPQPGDRWHMDAVFIVGNGVTHSLWRAIDQAGHALDIPVQARRDAAAARTSCRAPRQGLQSVPRVGSTDTRARYSAAKRLVRPGVGHRRHKGSNNRAENAHQPTRERERRMGRFTSPGHAQRFLAAYGPIAAHFRPRRHRLTAAAYRQHRDRANATWCEVTGVAAA